MKKVIPYLFLSFGMTWGIWLVIWLCGVPLGAPISQLATIIAMWMPALAFFILRKLRPADFQMAAHFSIRLKDYWPYYLLALWLPALLSLLGAGLYFLIFRSQFNLNFESLQEILEAAGIPKGSVSLRLVAFSQFLSALTYAPFLNSFFALGEEIGWRGFLYPALREHFSPLKTHVLVGFIWSLWHLPINLQGYNYGLSYWAYPWLGILAMFVFCFSAGILLSWLMEKTDSIWAPALLHGAINASAGLGLLFQTTSEQALSTRIFGPSPAGLLSVLPFLLLALVILQKERIKVAKNSLS